jgi:hypothetical protein
VTFSSHPGSKHTARAKRKAVARGTQTRANGAARRDAISLLKADHRQVEAWFGQFQATRSAERKAKLAGQICQLIAQIESSGPDDDYFAAKVKVLSEMIKHHVKEEEKRGGMLARARQSDMDLKQLGEQRMGARPLELLPPA